jgi:hypothetical protein
MLARAKAKVGLDGLQRAPPDDVDATTLQNMTAQEASTWILTRTPTSFQRMMAANFSNGFERDEGQLKRNNADETKWTNPLEIQLPYAPSMKMYCVYGHGKETEVWAVPLYPKLLARTNLLPAFILVCTRRI